MAKVRANYNPWKLIARDVQRVQRLILSEHAERRMQAEIGRLEFENRILRAWLWLKEEDNKQGNAVRHTVYRS